MAPLCRFQPPGAEHHAQHHAHHLIQRAGEQDHQTLHHGAQLDRDRGPQTQLCPALIQKTEQQRRQKHPQRMVAPHQRHRNADETRRIAIENRRKQLAECIWLRQRVLSHLEAGEDLLVMGDFNDGPGLDEYEKLFGHSGVEVVMGVTCPPEQRLFDPHAQMALESRLQPTTARFYNTEFERYFEALLDFIMVTPRLAAQAPRWRIWHPLNDPACWRTPELRDALLAASDHFPVTLDLPL